MGNGKEAGKIASWRWVLGSSTLEWADHLGKWVRQGFHQCSWGTVEEEAIRRHLLLDPVANQAGTCALVAPRDAREHQETNSEKQWQDKDDQIP